MASNSPGDLPSREQLELFSPSGHGAPHDMAKKSSKPSKSEPASKSAEKSAKKSKGKGGGGGGAGGGGGGGAGGAGGAPGTYDASLEAEARRRYLNYALSVI